MATTTVARSQEKRRELADKLEQGYSALLDSQNYKDYLAVAARFHTYSAGNCLLIMMQRPGATRVAGFKAWQKLGRQVRKGERAIRIYAPMVYRARDDEAEGDDEQARRVAGFRSASVFDISQTDGDELPEVPCAELSGDDAGLFSKLSMLAQAEHLAVTRDEPVGVPDGALGCYDGSRIWIKSGLSPAQSAKTLAHELGHHFGEHKSVCRDAGEIEAESVAYIVLGHHGIDASAYSFGYLASWADDSAQLRERLGHVLELANTIIDGVDGLEAKAA